MEAFQKVDEVLYQAVKGISDVITVPGLVNVDFADVRTIMSEMGQAIMGSGVARGENRGAEAARLAISSPLLEDISIKGAKGVLINITGSSDLTLNDINEASALVHEEADPDATIIMGAVIDETMADEIRVTVIATGLGREEKKALFGGTGIAVTPHTDLEKPAFMRRGRQDDVDVMELTPRDMVNRNPFEPSTDEDDIYDTPTFLRKQAD